MNLMKILSVFLKTCIFLLIVWLHLITFILSPLKEYSCQKSFITVKMYRKNKVNMKIFSPEKRYINKSLNCPHSIFYLKSISFVALCFKVSQTCTKSIHCKTIMLTLIYKGIIERHFITLHIISKITLKNYAKYISLLNCPLSKYKYAKNFNLLL